MAGSVESGSGNGGLDAEVGCWEGGIWVGIAGGWDGASAGAVLDGVVD